MKRLNSKLLRSFSIVMIIILLLFCNATNMLNAFAIENDVNTEATQSDSSNEKNVIADIREEFKDRKISKYEYIYNLDDSADYIYVEFENCGYAIFSRSSMEMLECSLYCNSPYGDVSRKYYAGPSNYFQKTDSKCVNLITNEELEISSNDTNQYAQKIRESLNIEGTYYVNNNDKLSELSDIVYKTLLLDTETEIDSPGKDNKNARSAPDINTDQLIVPDDYSGVVIANYNYFLTSPTRGSNIDGQTYADGNSSTCGSVAAQLLLSYNNYFNDRRLIDDKYLNGYDDNTNTISSPELNPNFCSDPSSMTQFTTGTRSEPNATNSFYCKVIRAIMEPNQVGASIKEVHNGINLLLNENLSTNDYVLDYQVKNWFFGYSPIDSEPIKNEIDAGRPLILSLSEDLGAIHHQVIGYGYQNYTYPDGGGTYEGYVVDFGWSNRNFIWVNSSWCKGYISLKLNHTHNYYKVKSITNTNRSEYKCSTCGHRTDAGINVTSRTRYIECIGTIDKPFGYKDFYITFQSSGEKIIQTFGNRDTLMYLYDSEYNLITTDDDDGYNTNSLISAYFTANTPYILRVKFFSFSSIGDIKVGITPARGAIKAGISAITKYEDIYNIKSTAFNWGSWLDKGYTKVITFTPPSDGKYSFNIVSNYDTYLYVIDPRSNQPITSNNYNDDGGENLNPYLSIDLDDSVTYFVIYSFLNPNGINSNIDLTLEIRKISS